MIERIYKMVSFLSIVIGVMVLSTLIGINVYFMTGDINFGKMISFTMIFILNYFICKDYFFSDD